MSSPVGRWTLTAGDELLDGMHLRQSGAASRHTLLLLHPIGADLTIWDGLVAALGTNEKVVRYSLRGAGRSAVSDRPWSIDDHMRDIETIREHLSAERLVVMGAAISGIIALNYAVEHAATTSGFIWANPSTGARRERSEPRIRKAMAAGTMAAIAEDVTTQAWGDLPHGSAYEHFRDEVVSRSDPLGYGRILEGLYDAPNQELLPRLTCPALFLAGAEDRINPPNTVAVPLAAAAPRSRLEVIHQASHFGPYQAPAAFARHVLEFLSSLP